MLSFHSYTEEEPVFRMWFNRQEAAEKYCSAMLFLRVQNSQVSLWVIFFFLNFFCTLKAALWKSILHRRHPNLPAGFAPTDMKEQSIKRSRICCQGSFSSFLLARLHQFSVPQTLSNNLPYNFTVNRLLCVNCYHRIPVPEWKSTGL